MCLNDEDRAIYAWQLDVPGLGESGQKKLRNTTALVSRVGGLGGPLAYQLAAAGFGKIILAHGGELKPSDLNRQILMRHDSLGKSRADCAAESLRAFNPGVEIEAIPENMHPGNVSELVGKADIVFDCAPLFEERFLMNGACVEQRKPMIDCAMFNLEGQVVSIVPGRTPCLACLYPTVPEHWTRRFPVIGAVSALVANIGVLEGIKMITGLAPPALNQMIYVDTLSMQMKKIRLHRRLDCPVCSSIH